MAGISYRRHRFPPAIIQHAVWLYLTLHLELPRRRGTPGRAGARHLLRNRPVLGAEIRTADRTPATPGPSAAELVEARRLSGDNRYATIAGFKRAAALGAKTQALAEDTFFAGLRKARMPEE